MTGVTFLGELFLEFKQELPNLGHDFIHFRGDIVSRKGESTNLRSQNPKFKQRNENTEHFSQFESKHSVLPKGSLEIP